MAILGLGHFASCGNLDVDRKQDKLVSASKKQPGWEGDSKMLFMCLWSYKPDQRDEVVQRRLEKGPMRTEGVKEIGEWSALQGGRGFTLVEAEDPVEILTSLRAWTDKLEIEIVPVIETDDVMKLVSS